MHSYTNHNSDVTHNCQICKKWIAYNFRFTPFCKGCQDSFEAKVWRANNPQWSPPLKFSEVW